MLMEDHQKLLIRTKFKTLPGTVDRIFELHEKYEKNESGEIPVIIKKEEETTKKKIKNSI